MARFFQSTVCICATALLMAIFSTTVFAQKGGLVGNNDFSPSEDTAHPYLISTSQFLDSDSQVLNQYCSSSITPSGTHVTTWKLTGHPTQQWEVLYGSYNDRVFVCKNNNRVAINIYRSERTPEVNVLELYGNNYEDVALHVQNYGNGALKFYTEPRGNLHSGNMYITVTSEATDASDGTGQSKKCRWTTSGTYLYEQDVLSNAKRLRALGVFAR